jgi:hypothetical protein
MKGGSIKRVTLLLLILFILSLFLYISAGFSHESSQQEHIFSIVWVTDTQYLSEKYPKNFDMLCNWIVDYSDALNVKAVVHTGDIVERNWNRREWEAANHAMSILLDASIPYCWDAGNHDQYNTTWVGKDFAAFNTSTMRQKSYWVDDILDGKNTAICFNDLGQSFIVINIECHANDTVLHWANNLLDRYSKSHAIIATHAYLNESCKYDKWAYHFRNTVLANHSNVFLTLSGHFMQGTRANRTFVQNRHELFFNYQHTNGGAGDSTIRILTFDIAQDAIIVNTYNPVTKQRLSDPDNHFILDMSLNRPNSG